jgi:protein O-GlcNAc transferase
MGHADAARQIFRDQVDILVDLRGHTKGNRFISALRPAPIQVFYLGYPGTTGAEFYDYMITDKMVTPEAHADYYSEKLVFMPHCYQINDHEQAISDKLWKRSDFNIPENSFVFCSFNGSFKIEPVMFDTWMRILHRVPNSILWLLKVNDMAERNLKNEAAKRGVNPERLIFSKGLPKEEHLARFKLAHLGLDTRIVNGHTTTSDALWAGVPVITLMGGYFPSRVSASILNAMGLPELITQNMAEYESLAIYFANNRHKLDIIRHKLLLHRQTKPLFNTPRFVKNLEKAYSEMWGTLLAGKSPQQIEITDLSSETT